MSFTLRMRPQHQDLREMVKDSQYNTTSKRFGTDDFNRFYTNASDSIVSVEKQSFCCVTDLKN